MDYSKLVTSDDSSVKLSHVLNFRNELGPYCQDQADWYFSRADRANEEYLILAGTRGTSTVKGENKPKQYLGKR